MDSRRASPVLDTSVYERRAGTRPAPTGTRVKSIEVVDAPEAHDLVFRLVISKAWRIMGKSWPVQDAKARFSELLECAVAEGPQVVTKRGVETAVLLPIEQWRRLERMARPNLKDLLLASEARTENLTPPRRSRRRRTPPAFE